MTARIRAGNAISVEHDRGSNVYRVRFGRRTDGCVAVAGPAVLPEPGEAYFYESERLQVQQQLGDVLEVITYDAQGRGAEVSFNVFVAC